MPSSFAKPLCALAVSLSLLAGCEGNVNNEAIGTVSGAAIGMGLGALAGRDARPATMTMGAIIGGVAGNQIGRKLDRADQQQAYHTHQRAMESGRSYDTTGWYNPDNGTSGTVTPQPAYQNPQGEYCREYTETVVINGKEEKAYGTACRRPDGSWELI